MTKNREKGGAEMLQQSLLPFGQSFLAPMRLRNLLFLVSFAFVCWQGSEVARAQSFLEKLEAAVRQQLDQPQGSNPATAGEPKSDATAVPSEIPNQGKRTPPPIPSPNQAPSEELPPPASASAGERTRSILERPVPANDPGALQLTPNAPAPNEGRVYLGLEVEELLGGGIGVRVAEVAENSPAWKAGFRVGDRIQGIDGHAIANIDNMAERLRRNVPGNPTKFLINRSGRNMELVAVLQDAEIASRVQANIANAQANGPAWLGAAVNDVTPAFRAQFGLSIFSGAAVISVSANSPAQLAGIKPGDAIVEVSGVPVTQGEDLKRWVAQATVGTPAELIVYRGTQRLAMSTVLSTDPRFAPVVERQKPTTPNVIRPLQSSAPSANSATALQAEVEQLRAELALTQEQLQQTQLQLEQVLQRLDQRP